MSVPQRDQVLDASRRLAKIGGSLLICVGFMALVVALSGAVAVKNWMILVGLVLLAVVLRLNLARVDRKYAREEETRRRLRED